MEVTDDFTKSCFGSDGRGSQARVDWDVGCEERPLEKQTEI